MSAIDTTDVQLVNGLSCSVPADSPLAKLLKTCLLYTSDAADEL